MVRQGFSLDVHCVDFIPELDVESQHDSPISRPLNCTHKPSQPSFATQRLSAVTDADSPPAAGFNPIKLHLSLHSIVLEFPY